ncbi:MAG: serine hydrolase [Weeksellaceae bacterium]|nr:serine hydrolase [Weeksellaceae bacterium]
MLYRLVVHNFADIGDHKIFPAREIQRVEGQFALPTAVLAKVPQGIEIDGKSFSFEKFLEMNQTVAFLIVQNDSVQYERYFRDYYASSIVPSFSMAKAITSILIGCAIEDGLIGSVDDAVTVYIPELTTQGFDKVTIEHLLQMTSGLEFNESYSNPFGEAARYYYGTDLRKEINKLRLKSEPRKQFEYVSGNTQLLGLVLERALQNKTISQYLEEKIWKKLPMEYDASWSLDRESNGLEKTFCCINTRARDYAKIGMLYLKNGKWHDTQIVPEEWVKTSTKIDTANASASHYQYQWWLPTSSGDFMAHGILGQYIYVNPEKNLVIVRLGKKEGKIDWWTILPSLAEAL